MTSLQQALDVVGEYRLSRIQAARAVGLHPDTITRLSREGALPFILVAGHRRYRPEDIEALVDRRGR